MENLSLDLAELKSLRQQSKRDAVVKMLDGQIAQIERAIKEQQAKDSATAETAPVKKVATTPASTQLPTVKLTNYAWDQSDKFVKIYLSLKGVHTIDASKITHTITNSAFDVLVSDLAGKNYTIGMKDLLQEIIPEQSQVKQKTDDLLVMLRKKDEGKTWDALTKAAFAEKEKNKPKFDEEKSDDPQAGLMNRMKQMYDTGDDEMKRNIRKAWHEGQNKKGGMGDMGGMNMPDF